MKIVGIDISHYQGVGTAHNLRDYHSDGAEFIIAKATQRHNYTDPGYESHANQMQRLGDEIVPGAYHWITQHDGVTQARHFVSTVKRAWGGDVPAAHIWAIDLEKPQTGLGDRYCSWPNFVEFVNEFQRLVPQSALWVYTRPDIWMSYFTKTGGPHNPNGKSMGLLNWNAYWVLGNVALSKVDVTKVHNQSYTPYGGWHGTPIQQVTSDGHSHGIRLDIDVFDGSMAELRALCSHGNSGGGTDNCPTGYHKDSSGVCVPNTSSCPPGYHKDANGICVPSDGNGDGTDEPWDDIPAKEQAKAAGIVGIGVGSSATLLVVGVGVAIAAALYMAYKAGSGVESVRDFGEKD